MYCIHLSGRISKVCLEHRLICIAAHVSRTPIFCCAFSYFLTFSTILFLSSYNCFYIHLAVTYFLSLNIVCQFLRTPAINCVLDLDSRVIPDLITEAGLRHGNEKHRNRFYLRIIFRLLLLRAAHLQCS